MRFVVFAFIAGVAAFMGWLFVQPVCPGGVLATTEAECRAGGTFSARFCHEAFVAGEHVARQSGGFSSQTECLAKYNICIEGEGFIGYVAKPKGYCVKAKADGAPSGDPFY